MNFNITNLINMNQIEIICKALLIILFLGFMLKVFFESAWLKYLEKSILKTKIEGDYIGKTDILYKRIFTDLKYG